MSHASTNSLLPENNERRFTRFQSTLLFCDIRGFTQFFDRSPPEMTYEFVSSVLGRFAKIVESFQGEISNFTGDGFLAQFRSSVSLASSAGTSHECRAISCAIQIRRVLEAINLERHTSHEFAFSLGIGINTGEIAGGIVELGGTPIPLILGDVVNTAARIEGLCKFFSVDILISESTEEAVRGKFHLQAMPAKELRGKSGKHKTFWVMPAEHTR